MWWHRRKSTPHNKKMKLRNKRNSDIFSDFRKQKEDMVEFRLAQKTEESVPSEIEIRIPDYDPEVEEEKDDEIPMTEEIGNNVIQEKEEEADLSGYLICEEFAMLFDRLGLKMDDKVDINAIYRALCGRSPCGMYFLYCFL